MSNSLNILLIDNDPATAEYVREGLEAQRHNITVVKQGREGLNLLAKSAYNIIVMELGLPDMSGQQVLRELRINGNKTPVLVLSQLTGVKDIVGGLQFGADDYMTKPFHMEELVQRIHSVVGRCQPKSVKTGPAGGASGPL